MKHSLSKSPLCFEDIQGFISKFNLDAELKWSTNINTSPQSISSSEEAVYIAGLGANGKLACNALDADGFTPICGREGGDIQIQGNGYLAKFNRRDELLWSTGFNGNFEYCFDQSLYSYYEDVYPEVNGYYIAAAFSDVCPNNLGFVSNEKILDIACSPEGALYLAGTNYISQISLISSSNMYFDQLFYQGSGPEIINGNNNSYYFTEAFMMAYSDLNYQFYGSYFGQEASGVVNFGIANRGNSTDFGRAISLSPLNSLFLGGYSFAPNQCFPFKEAPPATPEPYFQSFSGEEEYNAFIARFDVDIDLLPLSVAEENYDTLTNKVYPNPTNSIITISFEKKVNGKITVNNLMGQLLINESVKGETTTLDLSNFSSGIYFVNFIDETGGDFQSFKVIKQ